MTNFWTLDVETTGLPFGFRQQKQPTSIVQMALRSPAGVTEDFWTEHSRGPLTSYFAGKYGQGERAARTLLDKLLSGEGVTGAAWQRGILDPSNTLGTVFRQYMATAHESYLSGQTTFQKALPGVGTVSRTFGATETQLLDRVKGLLDKGEGIQGWNFNYDIQRLHETAVKLGRTDVADALNQAWRSGKARDLSQGWHELIWHKTASPALAGGDPGLELLHRSRGASTLTRQQLLAEKEKTLQALAKGEKFVFDAGDQVLERQPGFQRWLDKSFRDQVAAELGVSTWDIERRMATYSGFRDVSFEYAHRVGAPGKTAGNLSFAAGRVRPELQYVGLWSLDTITGALGLKEKLATGGVSQKALSLQWGLHDASVDTLVTEQVNRLSSAFEKSGMEGFRKELSTYGMSEDAFFDKLQHHARLHAIQKGLEKTIGQAGYDIAEASKGLAGWLPPGAKPNSTQYAASLVSSVRKKTEPGLLQVLGAQGYNLAQKFQGKNRYAWYAGAAAVGLSAVAGMFNEGRATPESGVPRLSSAMVEALPAIVKSNYLQALNQAELAKRGMTPGDPRAFAIRNPRNLAYLESQGISASKLSNVSDFGSGFDIHKALYRAGRLSAAQQPPTRHTEDFLSTGFFLSRYRSVDKTRRTVVPDAEARAVLGSMRAQRPPAFHLMEDMPTYREGSRIREDRRVGWLGRGHIITKPPTPSPRFSGKLITDSLARPQAMQPPVMPVRIDTGIKSPQIPNLSRYQMGRGTWHSEATVLDVVAMGARNGYQPPPMEMRGSFGIPRFSGDAILTNPKPIWSNVTYIPPKGIQGPWNEGIHGFRPSQFQSKFPFGSQANEQLNVAAFDMLAAQLMGIASVGVMLYGVMGGKGFVGMEMSSRALRKVGVHGIDEQKIFKQKVFEQIGRKYGFHPSKVRTLMRGAGFSDVDELKWRDFDESGFKGRKGFWGSIRDQMDEARAFQKALPTLGGAGAGAVMFNRAADSLKWLSGGELDSLGKRIGFLARIRNAAINSIFTGGMAGHEEVASAIEDVVAREKTLYKGLSGRSAVQLSGKTPTLFGSRHLGIMKNSWASTLSRWGDANLAEMSRLEQAQGAMANKVYKYREAQYKAHLQKAGSNFLGRLTGARVAFGALGAAGFALSWKARAERVGGMSGIGIGFMATLPEFTMMGVGAAVGSALGIPGMLVGSFIGGAIGSVIGDVVESIGGSVFGHNMSDPTAEYVRTRNSMPYRNYYQSNVIPGNPNMAWPGVGAEADEAYGVSTMQPGTPNLSDFGSPYRVPAVLRQPVPKPPPVKRLRLNTPAGTVQRAWKERSMSRIRDRASKSVV